MQNVLIVGATSAMAIATARQLATRGTSFYLLARDEQQLGVLAQDLEVRGAARVATAAFDAENFQAHAASIAQAFEFLGSVDLALVCHGSLPDQDACAADFSIALREIHVNGTSALSVMTHIANHMEKQSKGCIAAITSVAGDRGRQSNYVYGAAKSMVSTFLQGLRNRLYSKGVHVIDIRPGFVDTPMTAELDKNFLWAQPDRIATDILNAVERKRHTVYTPWIWRYIMLLIRLIPEPVFRRLHL